MKGLRTNWCDISRASKLLPELGLGQGSTRAMASLSLGRKGIIKFPPLPPYNLMRESDRKNPGYTSLEYTDQVCRSNRLEELQTTNISGK